MVKRETRVWALVAVLFIAATRLVAAQTTEAVLAAIEGRVEVYVDNKPVGASEGMVLPENAMIRAKGGTALIFFPSEGLYGVIHDSAERAGSCMKRTLPEDKLRRIKAREGRILDIFLETPPPAAAKAEGADAISIQTNINLILIIDASTSMRHEFSEMQDYVYSLVMEQRLKTGDHLSIFIFGAETRNAFAKILDLPADQEAIRKAIYAVKPVQEATDIGAMLSELQDFVRRAKLPNRKTVIVWATDGKNNPLPESPWAGKDIYDPSVFDAYTIVKSAAYKVLLLSIGTDTAARSLSDPLGGEIVEVASDAKAAVIGDLLADFADSIEMIAPPSIGRVGGLESDVTIAFHSTYKETRTVIIDRVLVSVDGGPKAPMEVTDPELVIEARDQTTVDFHIAFPANLEAGEHVMEFELVAEGNNVMRPIQQIRFAYSPFNFVLAGAIALAVALIVIVFILVRTKRAKAKD